MLGIILASREEAPPWSDRRGGTPHSWSKANWLQGKPLASSGTPASLGSRAAVSSRRGQNEASPLGFCMMLTAKAPNKTLVLSWEWQWPGFQLDGSCSQAQLLENCLRPSRYHLGFPGGAEVKNPPTNAGDVRECKFDSRLGRSPGEGNGNPLQYPCLKNSMDRGAWWSSGVHGVTKSLGSHDWLCTCTTKCFHKYRYKQVPWVLEGRCSFRAEVDRSQHLKRPRTQQATGEKVP